jgi:hypothetical protein
MMLPPLLESRAEKAAAGVAVARCMAVIASYFETGREDDCS